MVYLINLLLSFQELKVRSFGSVHLNQDWFNRTRRNRRKCAPKG